MARALALSLVLAAAGALAQTVTPERELETVKLNYDNGNYQEALNRARNAMEVVNFNDAQRIELHKLAGLSAYNLGDPKGAEKHFFSLLQLNPDYVLDPFAVAPPAIRLFEDLKKRNADALNLIRQNLALRDAQTRREEEERKRQEDERKRLEQLSRQITVRTVDHRSFVVNFIPFGAGQFQQGRTGVGIFLASFEGALAATSLVAYLAIEALFEPYTYSWTDRLYPVDGNFTATVRRIPPERRNEANVWRYVKLSTGIGFYAVWAAGIIDAILHHQDEVVTEESKRIDEVLQKPAAPKPGVSLNLFPTTGGLGAGLTVRF